MDGLQLREGVGGGEVAFLETVWERLQTWLLGSGIAIVATVILALTARWLLVRFVSRVVSLMTSKSAAKVVEAGRAGRLLGQATGLAHERHTQRLKTLASLLRSIITFVVFTVAVLTIMPLIGLPLGPLLASAGVAGVALGFGAQSLVKDFLSGVFMIFEDQYGVGDVIDTGDAVGTVEEVGLRVTRLRDANGVTWYIRNGEIIRVGNKSQGWSQAIVDMPVSYAQNIDHVLSVMRAAVAGLEEKEGWDDRLLQEPEVVGVESITGNTVLIRTLARTRAGDNYTVQRDLRELLKGAMDAAGVKPPPAVYAAPVPSSTTPPGTTR